MAWAASGDQNGLMAVPRFEPLRTERLVIRPMVASDADALWERRNHESSAEFQNWTLPYPKERAKELVDGMVALDGVPPGDGWIQFSVDDAADGSALGDLALHLTFGGRCAEIGFTVAPSARGRGVATEAATALVRWVFETLGATRVGAMMHPDNLASVRAVEHLGMVFEGHTRNSYWVGEENSDDWYYGMTAEAWRQWIERPSEAPVQVELVEITPVNLAEVERLATHHSQRRFVSPMAGSFADALVPEPRHGHPVVPWLRAVEADGEIVGFVMCAEPTEYHQEPYLWRLLIDRLHQRRGIGSAVLDHVINWARSSGSQALTLSWGEGIGSPAPLYLTRGFVPTGEIDDGEVVARLILGLRLVSRD